MAYYTCMPDKLLQSCPTLCNLWTVAHGAPLSMGQEYWRQEYWSGLLFAFPGALPNPGIKPTSLQSPLAGRFFTAVSFGR